MALMWQKKLNKGGGSPLTDMELGTKIKIAGVGFVLIDKNHAGYPSGALTVISEGSVNNGAFGSSQIYLTSSLRRRALNFSNNMSEAEKKFLIQTPIISNGQTLNDYIFVPSEAEYGGGYSGEGSVLGIIRQYSSLGIYHWTRSKYIYNDVSCYCFYPNNSIMYYGYNYAAGTQICMSFDSKAKLKKQDSDGYWLF